MPSRILIADASPTIQRVVKLIFAERGFEVTGVSDGLEARGRLNEIKPDIVIASVSLPGRNGYELCDDVKRSPRFRDVPVVLLVGGFEQYDQAEAFRVRADALLASPPEERAALETVRKLLSERKSLQTAPLISSSAADVEGQKVRDSAEMEINDPLPAATLPLVSNEERTREALKVNANEPANGASFFNKYVPTERRPLEVVGAEQRPPGEGALTQARKEGPAEPVSHEGAALVVWSLVACLVLGIIAIFVFLPLRSKETIPSTQPPAEVASSRASNETENGAGGDESKADVEGEAGVEAEVDVESESADDTEAERTETAQIPPAYSSEPTSDNPENDLVREGDSEPSSESNSASRRRNGPLAPRAAVRANPERAGFDRGPGPRASVADRTRLLRRARYLEESGDLERAENQYRYILDRFPNEREGRLGLRRVEARKSQARREAAIRASRANREAGLTSFRSGNYADAVNKLNQAASAGLRDTPVLYALASSYLKLNRVSEARAAFERCLAGNPNYAPALVGLARAHIAVGRKDQAVALLRRALELGGGAEYSPNRIREMISSLTGNNPNRTR